MARRTIVVDSYIWKVNPAGRITVYGKDEFGLLFELGTGPERKRRFTRYAPPAVPTRPSPSSLSGSSRTCSASRNPAGGRKRRTLNGALPGRAHTFSQSASGGFQPIWNALRPDRSHL